jgi:hypothetical protein
MGPNLAHNKIPHFCCALNVNQTDQSKNNTEIRIAAWSISKNADRVIQVAHFDME